jgi:hypothetical protein
MLLSDDWPGHAQAELSASRPLWSDSAINPMAMIFPVVIVEGHHARFGATAPK